MPQSDEDEQLARINARRAADDAEKNHAQLVQIIREHLALLVQRDGMTLEQIREAQVFLRAMGWT